LITPLDKSSLKKSLRTKGEVQREPYFPFKFFWAPFLFKKGCGAERCLWQMQRGEARAKQRETKQSAGFDYVLPLVMRGFQSFR